LLLIQPMIFDFRTLPNAGVQPAMILRYWMPAFAGMTATWHLIGLRR